MITANNKWPQLTEKLTHFGLNNKKSCYLTQQEVQRKGELQGWLIKLLNDVHRGLGFTSFINSAILCFIPCVWERWPRWFSVSLDITTSQEKEKMSSDLHLSLFWGKDICNWNSSCHLFLPAQAWIVSVTCPQLNQSLAREKRWLLRVIEESATRTIT